MRQKQQKTFVEQKSDKSIAVYCSILHYIAVYRCISHYIAVCRSISHYIALYCIFSQSQIQIHLVLLTLIINNYPILFRNRSLLRSLRKNRRQKLRQARLRQRLRRRMQRQKRKEKSKKKLEDSQCREDERLNCFSHNNDHWKTPPFWNEGSFCACTNSNTNTYSCVRNVNETHNYLYCEFVSGLITYYNLKVDPYQLRNIYMTLSTEELNFMHHQLAVLKNHGLKYSRMYDNFVRQRNFIQKFGK